MNIPVRGIVYSVALAAGLALAGCATGPSYGNGGYGQRYGQGYGGGSYGRCQSCGVVQDVRQVRVDGGNSSGGVLGAVIGAVAGGVLGSTIGKGDGRKAATVAGAVAGGVIGNQVGEHSGSGNAWRIVVRLDNGQYATVTQRDDPGVRNGDYVQVRNGQVYPM